MVIDKELKDKQSWIQLIVPFLFHESKYTNILKMREVTCLKKLGGKEYWRYICLVYFQIPIYRFKFLVSLPSVHYLHHENILINEWTSYLTQQIILALPPIYLWNGWERKKKNRSKKRWQIDKKRWQTDSQT